MARKRTPKAVLPHSFVEGDHVKVNQERWDEGRRLDKWTNPEHDTALAADTYVVVQAYPMNPFVAVVSDTTGKRLGLSIRVLDKIEED